MVFGADGQIGRELCHALGALGAVLPARRDIAELARPDSIRAAMRETRPALVVNAAAYTRVDTAESEIALATAVNAAAPAVIAEEANRAGIGVVQYSTDYVFDGMKGGAYVEDDEPNPLGVYGRTKLEGERAIRRANPPHLILRTSWVYSSRRSNFLLTMLRLARERDELRVVDDQIGAPTWARSIAEATAQLLSQAMSGRGDTRFDLGKLSGIYHMTASGYTSWYGFARAIFDEFGSAAAQPRVPMVPIRSTDYELPARRPANSRLSNEKLRKVTGLQLPDWRASLRLCVEEIKALQRGCRGEPV